MSKELATLIGDARRSLWRMRGNVSEAIDSIDEHLGKISTKGELIKINDALSYIRLEAEKIAEIEEKLRKGKFF